MSLTVVGVKIIFKVALVVLKFSLGRQGVLKRCPTMYETLEVLRNPPQEIMEEEFVVYQVSVFSSIEVQSWTTRSIRQVYIISNTKLVRWSNRDR